MNQVSGQYATSYIIFCLGFTFNLLETWYFGWNRQAICKPEQICDAISAVMILGGAIAMVVYRNN